MTTSTSKRAVGIGAAVGIAGATAVTWFAVDQGSSTTAGSPVPAAPAASVMHPMPHAHVVANHHRHAVSRSTGPAAFSFARIRSVAARAGRGRVQEISPGDNPGRMTYDVAVTRSDGTEVTVVVDARSAMVLAIYWDGRSDGDTPPDPQHLDGTRDTTRGD